MEVMAVIYIQRRWQVRLCRKSANSMRETNAQRQTNAGKLLAQTKSVAMLEQVLKRHRAANGVMMGVYSQVSPHDHELRVQDTTVALPPRRCGCTFTFTGMPPVRAGGHRGA